MEAQSGCYPSVDSCRCWRGHPHGPTTMTQQARTESCVLPRDGGRVQVNVWHLPVVLGQAPVLVIVLPLLLVHCAIGVPLSIYWRCSGEAVCHRLDPCTVISVRNALLVCPGADSCCTERLLECVLASLQREFSLRLSNSASNPLPSGAAHMIPTSSLGAGTKYPERIITNPFPSREQ